MLVKCDSCGRKFSIEGVPCGEFQQGEIQGKFFDCTKCGARYIFSVTDEALRQEKKTIELDRRKLKTMIQKKFRKETTDKFQTEIQERVKKAFIRSQELKRIIQNGGENGTETD